MSAFAYYNENDPFAADWLERLAAKGLIADGWVDRRPIQEVEADELGGFTQHHFFAGIGGWSYALRLAGWEDDRAVWTGSCPCQPFSVAGKGEAEDDDRHLWPYWERLIAECRPAAVFGEQVASPLGRDWLTIVRFEMEALGYVVGAADLCAAGVGAPHLRQRLYFGGVADTEDTDRRRSGGSEDAERRSSEARGSSGSRRLADPLRARLGESQECDSQSQSRVEAGESRGDADGRSDVRGVGHPRRPRGRRNPGAVPREKTQSGQARSQARGESDEPQPASADSRLGHADGDDATQEPTSHDVVGEQRSPWSFCDWLPCSDGKWRPVEPGTFPLAHGIPKRVGKLRGYGNAIVPQVGAEFITAFMEAAAEADLL